jgi:hypothetical protein
MSSGTLFLDPDLRVRREDHSRGLLSWLAAINPANIGLQQGFRLGSERRRCARTSLRRACLTARTSTSSLRQIYRVTL